MRHKLVITGKSSPARDTRIFLPGTVTDRVMRRWLDQDDPQPGQMELWVPEMYEYHAGEGAEGSIRWRGAKDYYVTRNFVLECVRRLEPLLLKHVIPFNYTPELRFTVPIGIPYLDGRIVAINLVGGIDIVVQNPANDTVHIYDLKATANDEYWRKTLAQLTFYDIALMHYMRRRVPADSFGFIQPMCKEPFLPIKITDKERRVMMARIINMAQGIWRHEWDANKGSQCSMCEVKHACPAHLPKELIDPQGRRRVSF